MSSDISMPVTKAASAITAAAAAKADVVEEIARAAVHNSTDATWYAVMSIPWGTIASFVAALYTLLLISEWFWKKLWRPIFESRGWIKHRPRYVLTKHEWEERQIEAEKDQPL